MKIWLVVNAGYDYDYPEVLGIFTSEDNANNYLYAHGETTMPWNDRGIVEVETDSPLEEQIRSEE